MKARTGLVLLGLLGVGAGLVVCTRPVARGAPVALVRRRAPALEGVPAT